MNQILIFILQCVYLILPGIAANITPVLMRKVPVLETPIDQGRMYKGKPLFGKNKTYRGFVFGVLASIVIVEVQGFLFATALGKELSIINYSAFSPALLGFLMGFGTLFGDLVKSFFKRRKNIAPGKRFFPWDQLDSLVGGFVFLAPLFIAPAKVIVFLIFFVPALHVGINHLGFYVGLKETKW